MASTTDLIRRHAVALNGLVATAQRVAATAGVDAPEIPSRHRYPEMLPLVQMEALAGFLRAIEQRLSGGNTPSDASTASPDDESGDNDSVDLNTLTRAELNAKAVEMGIEDADTLPNKQAVIDAIEEALTAPDDDDGDEG